MPRSAMPLMMSLVLAGSHFGCGGAAMEMTITAGDKGLPPGPVYVKTELSPGAGDTYLLQSSDAAVIPGQVDAKGRLWWWASALDAKQSRTLAAKPARGDDAVRPRVEVKETARGILSVTVDGQPFTALNFKPDAPKVYLYPVIGPTGDPVTRDYPMKDNPVERENKRQDHHHHRSIWCAHGDVRTGDLGTEGANYWHETKEPEKQDRQVLTRVLRTVSGPVFAQIEAEIDWVTHAGERQFREVRTYTFFGGDDTRVIDVRNLFRFDEGDVMFGDTKEGGILSLRLAVTMDAQGVEQPERLHGQMTNIHGGVGAKECWGKAAAWCDYVGPVLTKDDGSRTVGVAVLDHPGNYGHPSRWHIRDYGLYTANPFGLSHFEGKDKNGSHTWKKGEAAEFNYRVIIHAGDTKAADIPGHWAAYKSPPGSPSTRGPD